MGVEEPGTPTTMWLRRIWLPVTRVMKALSIFSAASKLSMVPPRMGRKTSVSFGSRPSIL